MWRVGTCGRARLRRPSSPSPRQRPLGWDNHGRRSCGWYREDKAWRRRWNHHVVEANGIRIHYVRHGAGFPPILRHGWPGFWYVWRKNILPLAEHFDVIVPDQRGFGDTDKPDVPAVGG